MRPNDTTEQLAVGGSNIRSVIEYPGELSSQAVENIRNQILKEHSDPTNAAKPLVAPDGMKCHATQFSSADSELLESRKLSIKDVARTFGWVRFRAPASPACARTS